MAGCLNRSRTDVYTILEAFEREGFAGLEDQRTRPPDHPATQLSRPFLKEALDLPREYPRAGRFRVRGLLEAQRDTPPPREATVGRAMAINRPFHGAPGPWARAQDAAAADATPKPLPYRPLSRHPMWCIDRRYLVRLNGGWVYRICLLEGSSRQILAGMASPHPDLTVGLPLLFAALAE